jgi:hypothetical protein
MITLGLGVAGCGKHAAPDSENSPNPGAPAAHGVRPSASVARNLEWAGATLDNIETNIAQVIQENKLAATNSPASAFESARAKLATLRKAALSTETDSDTLAKALDFTKNVAGIPQPLLDRIGDLNGKRDTYRELMNDSPSLTNTDVGKRFGEAVQSLAATLVRLTACQVEQKQIEAGDAEGGWNLQSLRCDQIIDEGRDEASYLATKEDLTKSIREAGKTVSLAPLDAAREQVRAAKRRQQEAALAKQKLANQISQLNLQNQMLDDHAGDLDQARDQAGDAFDQARQKIQQAIDDDGQ